MKAMGDFVQGVAAYDAGKYTQRAMRTNAVNAERDGAAEGARIRDVARIAMGRQVAGLAQSGLTLSGSALDAVRESAIEAELDIQTTRRRAKSQADAFTSQGKMAYASGFNAMSGGIVSGAAKVLSSVTDYASAGAG